MTKQRRLILDIIMSSDDHLTAEEIYLSAKKIMPSIAMGTVYRNLGLMTESEEIRRITLPNGPDRFDKSMMPHEHAVCESCGRLSDISVHGLKDYLEGQTVLKILGYDLSLRYICDRCNKKNNMGES